VKLVSVLFLSCVFVGVFFPQDTSVRKSSLIKINPKGWDVPKLSQFDLVSTDELYLDGANVRKSYYLLKTPKPVVEVRKGSPCEFQELASYSVEGKIFGIYWKCVHIGIDPRYGKFYIGASYSLLFLDDDMDGKFELRTLESELALPSVLKAKYEPPPIPVKTRPEHLQSHN
jgi:hypothetical protein